MRDPNRIDPILARLRAAWIARPDLRLGQLLVGSLPMPAFYASPSDDAWMADRMRRLFNAECAEFGAANAPIVWPPVDRPAPTPTPAPGLDLDAVADTMRGLDNIFAQAMSSRDAEVRALRETVAMLRADIARYYDALTSERAKLAEVKRLQGQVAETAGYLRAELEPRGRTPSRTGVRELAARLEVIAAALEAL